MGLATTSNTGVGLDFFSINLKLGCFQQSAKGGEAKRQYEPGGVELTGVPFKFNVQEDEFEGAKSIKANLYLRDPEPNQPAMCVSWTIFTEANEASSTGLALLAKLYAADLSNPVVIKPWFAAQGTKMGDFTVEAEAGMAGIKLDTIINGERQTIRHGDYAGKGDKLPPIKEIPIPGTSKVHKSKDEWNSIMEAMVANLAARLPSKDTQKQAANEAEHQDIDPADVAGAADQSGMRARA